MTFLWGMVAGGAGMFLAVQRKARLIGRAARDCGCGQRLSLGVVHRADGPCYWPSEDVGDLSVGEPSGLGDGAK